MIREKLFNHIIEEAKRCAYNIATTTVPSRSSSTFRCALLILADASDVTGSREFYKQVGFQEVAKPVMLAEGTVEGVSQPVLLPSSRGKTMLIVSVQSFLQVTMMFMELFQVTYEPVELM